ncbi:hypothetical protein ACI78Q_01405 [Geodermatophilus sp. SYSU D00705]
MTIPADARAAEEAFEACLAGRPVPDGASGLAAFTDAVRAGATVPGRPNAALAELLATGLLTPIQEPSCGTAGPTARTSRKRPRMLLTTLAAKIASAGVLAKAAAGTGAVVVAVAGATTAGALTTPPEPAPVVETVVSDQPTDPTLEPTDPALEPTGSGDGTQAGTENGSGSAVPAGGEEAQTSAEEGEIPAEPQARVDEAPVDDAAAKTAWQAGPTPGQSHGEWVSEGARRGWVDGGTVSSQARQRNAKPTQAPAPVDEPVAERPVVEEPVVEQPAGAPAAQVADSGTGHGNAGGNGNGNGNGRK